MVHRVEGPQILAADRGEKDERKLFAAGELVGGLFYNNYPGGAGLMAGAVFGRIAGRSAAQAART